MSKSKKLRNKKTKRQEPIRKVGTPNNIVTIQPDPPRGSYLTVEAAQEAGKQLIEDLRAVFHKHQVAVTFCGALLPVAQWGDTVDAKTQKPKKAWLLKNVLASCVTSQHAEDTKPTLLGILNGLSAKCYGPTEAPGEAAPKVE